MKRSRQKIGCLCLTALLVCGCGILPEEEELRTAPVVSSVEEEYFRTEEVKTGDVVESIEVYCYYRKKNTADYAFSVLDENTSLQEIYVQEGDKVKEGTLLAELELGGLGDEIDEKQAAYDTLNEQVGYYETLLELEKERQALAQEYGKEFDDDTLSAYEEQLDSLRDQLHIAELTLEEVKADIGSRQLVAEFDGVVTYVKNLNGWERLRSGDTVVTVESEDSGFVCTTDKGEYFSEGDEVSVTTDVGVYEATVTEASETADGKTKLVMDVLNPDKKLVLELKGTVEFIINSAENVTYVPYSALRLMGDQYAVYVVDDDGMRELRYVEIGLLVNNSLTSGENRVEILSGVEPGETVIIR